MTIFKYKFLSHCLLFLKKIRFNQDNVAYIIQSLAILQKHQCVSRWLLELILTIINLCHSLISCNINNVKVTNRQNFLCGLNVNKSFIKARNT